MNRISELVEKIPPIEINTHLSDVLAYFRQNKHVVVVPVVSGAIPIGILREKDFKEYVYSPYGKEVLLNASLKKNINDFLIRCSVSDINTELELIVKLFSTEDNQDGIIITKNGDYFGFLSAFSILKMLNEKQTEEKFIHTLDSLVVGIVHEINTPLGIGITATSYIQEKLAELKIQMEEKRLKKSDMDSYIKNMQEASATLHTNLHRVANLTNLLKKISVNRHYGEKKRFRVFDCALMCKEMMLAKYTNTKHTITIDCDENLEIETYYDLFMEVILNLIENSLLHAFSDNKKGKIELIFMSDKNSLIFLCKDNGIGLDSEQKEKIFEPFYTTKRGKGNIGLGLNVVQNILAHKLNGSITIESEKGKGAIFKVVIPLRV